MNRSATARRRAPLALLSALSFGLGCGASATTGMPMPDLAGERLINGHAFAVNPGQSVVQDLDNTTNKPVGWVVELWDQDNGCAAAMSPPKNISELQLHFPLSPVGTYDVSFANTVFIVGSDFNAATPTSGKLQVFTFNQSAVPMRMSGSYDVKFMTGEHLAGTFDANVCF